MFEFVDVGDITVDVEPVSKDGVRFYPIPGADSYTHLTLTTKA